MISRPTRSDWLILLALGFMWGTSYVFIRLGVQTLPTFTLIAARLGIGLALLVTVVLVAREPLPRDRKIYGHLIVMAVVNIVLPFFLITNAERSVQSSLAAIINGSVPLGVIVLVSRSLFEATSDSSLAGALALVGSTLSYAAGAVYARRNMRGLRPMIPAVFQVGFAFVIVAVIALATENPFAVSWNGDAILAVVWLGILGSGFAYLANFRLLSRIGATRTALVAYLLPIVGIISGALMFAERVDDRLILGTLLILGGVALVNSRFGQRRLFGAAEPKDRAAKAAPAREASVPAPTTTSTAAAPEADAH